MRRKDQLRAVKLKQVARRIKDGSTKARRMSPREARSRGRAGAPPAAMTDPQAQRLEQLRAEADYHRQRVDLYRARLYGGRAVNPARLEELQRASDRAAERLSRAGEAASPAGRSVTP